jgi:PAS domain S-box-containing protein
MSSGPRAVTTAAIRILLVEDSPSDADLLQETLQRIGAGRFEFTWVECLEDALARLGQESFDVLLLDLSLPDSSGEETFRRARNAAPRLPIVVLTGANDEGLALTAVQEGVQDYLVKGQADARQIAHAIRYAIERQQAEEELRRNREWLRVTLSSMGDAVIAADTDGKVSFLNPVAASLTGWTPEEALGQPIQRVFHIINVLTREPAENLFSRVMRERRSILLANLSALVTRDDREIPIEDSAAPILDASGEVAGVVLVFHDVTEKRRAQAALAAAHAEALSERNRLQALMQALPVGVALVNAEGGNVRSNAAFEQVWRGPRPATQPVSDYAAYKAWWADTGRPVQPEEWASAVALQRGETVISQEMQIERFDGTRAFVLNSAAPIRDPQGQIAGSAVAIMDITERKRAEERIQHDKTVLEGINRILAASLSQGTEEDLGRVCLAVAEEVTQSKFSFLGEINAKDRLLCIAVSDPGWKACRIDQPADQSKLPPSFAIHGIYGRVLLDGKGFYTNEPASHPDCIGTPEGHPPLTAFMGVPLKQDGKTLGMIAVGNREGRYRPQDLEALEALAAAVVQVFMRKRAELALRQGREDLARAQAVAHMGSWRLDLQRDELRWSDETHRLFGIPLGTPLTYETFLGFVHPDDREFVDRSWQAALGGEPYDIDHRIVVNGAVRWIRERADMEFDRQGTLLGGFGTCQDITARKLLDAEREQQARLKDEFLALLGHELRNPLATIYTAVQLIIGGVAAERRAALDEMIGRQVTVLQRLVDDLLDLARITHGQIELQKERLDLSMFLQKASVAARSYIAGRGQELVVRLPSGRVSFMADSVRLEQIVANLLDNASKYTDRGGRIELWGAREASEVVIRCKDNGRGIPREMQEVIFEPFARVRATGTSAQAGIGIGLALVKRLAELHGGTVSVVSDGPGTGSEFIVRLPLGEAEIAQVAPAAGKPAPALREPRSLSIVVVEDNPDVAQALTIALEHAGHRVRRFADGPSALAGAARLKPGAILLDIGLPNIDGYELATRLREKQSLRNTLFVAISGFKRAMEAGKPRGDFDHYFVKPVDYEQLLAILEEHARAMGTVSKKPQTPKRKKSPRVLLVEDHAELAAMTAEVLRQEGLEVRTALSGREALEAASDFRPQLILCDLHLPDMPGEDLVRELRANPGTKRSRVVIVTALHESDVSMLRRRAKQMTVDRFVSKPLTVEKIRTLLAELKVLAK